MRVTSARAHFDWPYPFWIGHRGAGKLAPENTMAAFALGAQHGFSMFECDAKLSADGVLYLLHDDSLDRTTNASGSPATLPWHALKQLDAGSWHSQQFQTEPLLRLDALLLWCQAQGLSLNIEIKPLPGQDAATGRAIATLLERLSAQWPGDLPWPLVSSFSVSALAAFHSTGTNAALALLVEHWSDRTWEQTQALQCAALVCHYPLWSPERVAQCHAQGMRALSYTVNEADQAQALIAMHTDGIITDAIDRLGPGADTNTISLR